MNDQMSLLDWLNAAKAYMLGTFSGAVPYHEETVNEMNRRLLERKLGKPGIQNNPYDRAKNWSGGYDWAQKSGHDYDDIRDLGLAYQKLQQWKHGTPMANEMQDYRQNMMGALSALKDREQKKSRSMDEILAEAEKYGLLGE